MHIFLWILVAVTAAVIGGFAYTWNLSGKIYRDLLVRETDEKWIRTCSFPDDAEYSKMYASALAWRDEHLNVMQEVSVENDGIHLAGEYYDLGADKAVIIIPGRTEGCYYSCYFAEPYRAAGYNVLTIDNRAHGLSGGKYPALGFSEYRDILAWAKLLTGRLGNRSVFLHGICIGASTALFALTDPHCPSYMSGMTADGMYTTFFESFKRHMKQDHHPIFPVGHEIMLHILINSGANVVTDGPIKRINRLDRPILFLHSREDTFSLPGKAEVLYNRCGSENKRIHFFEKGAHSRIRYNNSSEYDKEIVSFLNSL